MPTLPLLLLAALAAAAPAKETASASTDPQTQFNERASQWRKRYDQRVLDMDALRKSLKNGSAAAEVERHYQETVQFHQQQLGLYKSLVKNQREALKDGVITREVFDRHIARLDRMMNERLLYLWGSVLPSRWNAALAKLPKAARPPGTPFETYPSEAEYRRFKLKDHTPIYEKSQKAMRVVRPEDDPGDGP